MGAVGLSSPLFASPLMGGMRGYLPRFFVPVDGGGGAILPVLCVPVDGAVGLSSLFCASLLMGEMILHKEKTAEAVFPVVSGSQ